MNTSFNIEGMSWALSLSPAEIKLRLGIPLDEKCEETETAEARKVFLRAPQGSEKQMAALKRWIELFLKEIETVDSLPKLVAMHRHAPRDHTAETVVLKKIAALYGFQETDIYQKPLLAAANLEEALRLGFDLLPLGIRLTGPKGKLMLGRNSVPKGHPDCAEIYVMRAGGKDNQVFLNASWGKGYENFKVHFFWNNTMEDLNEEW